MRVPRGARRTQKSIINLLDNTGRATRVRTVPLKISPLHPPPRICNLHLQKSLDLEIHCRCFSAVLFDLILDLLPFIERAQSGALNSGDMNKHVLAATAFRLNKSLAFGWIEPLHRASCHCLSPN
jgi:hypothetical protein